MQCLTNHVTDDQHHDVNLEYPNNHAVMWVKSTPLECLSSSTIIECSPHNSFDMYQSAFVFPTTKSLSAYQTEISVILFYNLALAHHLAGLSGLCHSPSKVTEAHLRQALRFYKLAMTVFKSNSQLNFDGSCFAIVLGAITNMGHIFTYFWNTQAANSCMRHLRDLLHSTSATVGISEEDGDFFFTVIAYSSETKAISAPAA